ncbi:MAG: hypothetical protein Q8N18_05715 [Opitutaceae bacterium]|nr:hypothetical protein [Opitutaceae bacterium]
MSPGLEALVKLYAEMHQAAADQQDVYLSRLKTECEIHAKATGLYWKDVEAFVKRTYFAGLAGESRRQGRPKES